jgi:DNA-binding CsgD family transcriptional regulator
MSTSLMPSTRTVRQYAVQPTARESEVLHLICLGCSTKEIARRLGTSFKTASCHRSRLLQKACVHNTIQLFRWALIHGFVSLSDGYDEERENPNARRLPSSVGRLLEKGKTQRL